MNSANRTRQTTSEATETSIRFAFGARKQRGKGDASVAFLHIDFRLLELQLPYLPCSDACDGSCEVSGCPRPGSFDSSGLSEDWNVDAIRRHRSNQNLMFELLPDGSCVLL